MPNRRYLPLTALISFLRYLSHLLKNIVKVFVKESFATYFMPKNFMKVNDTSWHIISINQSINQSILFYCAPKC